MGFQPSAERSVLGFRDNTMLNGPDWSPGCWLPGKAESSAALKHSPENSISERAALQDAKLCKLSPAHHGERPPARLWGGGSCGHVIASGRPALPPSASQPRPPWGEAAGTTLGRMFSREPQGLPILSSVRLHLGPFPEIEAPKRRGSDVAGRGPHHDSAEGGRFGKVYCRLDRPRQDSGVPPGPHAPWCRLVATADRGGPQAFDLPSPGRKAGFVPALEMREERQTGLRNVPQVAHSQALRPGRVCLQSDGDCRLCARGRTQPRVPRRRPPVGTTHQSPSQAYGLGADCGPQPPGTLAHAGAWTTEEEAHRGFQL
ncbi:unnamed protein product [Rangifer tarandus platyrhynchus]|uniref:Uncharacterized protein n=2 Tax=Rangifer tarandus platyrhynchus TaxID=3082113 RepID=A0ABN8ZQQ2_RANTA|nr:unnamed protein product [Rangifer tarandus platyrhynchus]CAI9709343.1 unnamed protein product [Rangifer tarandus platyrhynchus]